MMSITGRLRAFLTELRRRRVFRVAGVYAVVAFITLQVADLTFPALNLPGWTMTLLVVLAIFGFPLALVLAWALELTPDGVRRTEPGDEASTSAAGRGRVAWLALGLLLFGTLGWYGVARLGGEPEAPVDANAVAVLPFRVAGADPSLGYLREGMVDLLAAKLTGDVGPRAVDPRTLLSAWRRSVPQEEEDLPPDAAASLGRSLGAAQVLLGEVVSGPGRLVVTASLVDTRTGRVGPPASVEGPADSLPALVDQLTATLLMREAGEADHRVAATTTTSLVALRHYLRARAHYRAGRFPDALDGFTAALEEDSTFVLAAVGAAHSSTWTPDRPFEWDRVVDRAWRHRHRLASRDLAVLEALVGPRYPDRSTVQQRLAGWERVVRISPDDPEAWYEVGDALFHYHRHLGDGALDRAIRAFQRSLELDPGFGPVQLHLHDAAMLRGDTATAGRIARVQLEEDSTSAYALGMHLLVAMSRGDPDPVATAAGVAHRHGLPGELAFALIVFPFSEADPDLLSYYLRLADEAAVLAPERATTAHERTLVATMGRHYALNRGRTVAALRAAAELGQLADDPLLEHRLNLLAGLYWDGDPNAAARGATRLAGALAEAGGPRAMAATAPGRGHLCALAQWRLAREESEGAVAAAAALRSHFADDEPPASVRVCADLIEAWAAHLEGSPDADRLIQRVDRLLSDGLPADELTQIGNLAAAWLLEERGDLEAAYRAAHRQVLLPGVERYATTTLREQGRLAARLGRTDDAVRAYSVYLTFVDNPEPGPAADAAETARQELARLRPAG